MDTEMNKLIYDDLRVMAHYCRNGQNRSALELLYSIMAKVTNPEHIKELTNVYDMLMDNQQVREIALVNEIMKIADHYSVFYYIRFFDSQSEGYDGPYKTAEEAQKIVDVMAKINNLHSVVWVNYEVIETVGKRE